MNVEKLTDQWNQYCLENIKGGVVPKKNDVKPVRTDYYWSKIELMEDGMRHTKYLTILSVTAVLTSAHGNVDVV